MFVTKERVSKCFLMAAVVCLVIRRAFGDECGITLDFRIRENWFEGDVIDIAIIGETCQVRCDAKISRVFLWVNLWDDSKGALP